MNAQSAQNTVVVAGWAITAAAILGVSTTLIPAEHRSHLFWHRVLWAQFLAALVWAYFGVYGSVALLGRKIPRGAGGILPSFGIVIAAFAGLSFALMLLHAFLPETDFVNRFHLTGQILLMALAGTLCIFLSFTRTAAAHGTAPIPTRTRSPNQLAALLKAEQFRLTENGGRNHSDALVGALRVLRERIQYSLPHVGDIGTSADYQLLSAAVENVCEKLAANAREPATDESQAVALGQEISELVLKVDLIAESLKRR